jgi:hypothetical protein
MAPGDVSRLDQQEYPLPQWPLVTGASLLKLLEYLYTIARTRAEMGALSEGGARSSGRSPDQAETGRWQARRRRGRGWTRACFERYNVKWRLGMAWYCGWQ